MPRIAYIERDFTPAVLDVIDHANGLIADYAEQGLALTLRQLYYRFVAAALIPNSQKSYSRLGDIVNNARLAGLMDWNAIEDRGRNLERLAHWDSPGDIVETAANQFRFDKWEDQPNRVEVWVEKQALESVVGRACEPLDVPYLACKGYMSQSEMWRAAQRYADFIEAGQEVVVIHLGDHDPSGVDMTGDIERRLNNLFGVEVLVDRIALNMDQIRHYRPPPNPAKITDSRAKRYIAEHGHSSWELDALEPAVLRTLIQTAIKRNMNQRRFKQRAKEEAEAKQVMVRASQNWSDVEEYLDGFEIYVDPGDDGDDP